MTASSDSNAHCNFLRISPAFILGVFLATAVISLTAQEENNLPGISPPTESEWEKWSLQVGLAIITDNVAGDFLFGDFSRAEGDAGGEVSLFTVSRELYEYEWRIGGHLFRPQLQLRATLGVVDENGRPPFMDYNAGVTLRWRDFPWNQWVYTTVESGVGLSYTEKVFAIERERHPDRERSHLKFYWPIELTLAHPRHRRHQAVLLLHHQSGGRIFDKGGSNCVGAGYRYVFGD